MYAIAVVEKKDSKKPFGLNNLKNLPTEYSSVSCNVWKFYEIKNVGILIMNKKVYYNFQIWILELEYFDENYL